MNTARMLHDARLRAGLSQTALARAAGMSPAAVNRIERAVVTPRMDTMNRLLEACGAAVVMERRLGAGVDRTNIRACLDLPAQYRLASPLPTMLRILSGKRVRYVVVGDAAAALHGAPVTPTTLDICPDPDHMNRIRLRLALERLTLKTTAPIPRLSGRGRQHVRIDRGTVVLWWSLPYAELLRPAVVMDLEEKAIPVATIDDLIAIRLTSRRPVDRLAAEVLGALREEIDRRPPSPAWPP